MAQETTYSCDRCGKLIEEVDDNDTSILGSKNNGNLMDITIHAAEVRGGTAYSTGWQDLNENWELCMPCGRAVRKAMKEAMKNA